MDTIKEVRKFKHRGYSLTDGGRSDSEVRSDTEVTKYAFQKLNKHKEARKLLSEYRKEC